MSSEAELTHRIKALALALGCDLVGVAPATPTPQTEFLLEWIERGYAGCMDYLTRRAEQRVDPRKVLEGARSIVAVGLVYADPEPGDREPEDCEQAGGERCAAGAVGRVSRYAGGDDYHEVLGERLRALRSGIEAMVDGPVATRAYVDTGPVQERVFAALGGLGWIGKNTCLIHPEFGSYVFLGVLLTDLELSPDSPEPDHCGSCRACLDACPTQAFEAAYVLDATRCLAYSTIEDPGPIPVELRAAQADWVYGCDVCQEVCPWNQPSRRRGTSDPLGLRARLAPRSEWVRPTLRWLLGLDVDAWRSATPHMAIRRARHRGLLRNALVAAGNSGDRSLCEPIRRHALGDDELLAEHARWALAQLGEAPNP